MNNYRFFLLLLGMLCQPIFSIAQADSSKNINISGIPIVASSPETGFKFGAFSQVSFDAFKDMGVSRPSQVKIGITYSVKRQFSTETTWQLFDRNENYYITGNIEYQNWVDRHYGLGSDASNLIIEYSNGSIIPDTLNFLNYKINVFNSRLEVNKKIAKGWYMGLALNIYHANNFEILADSVLLTTSEIQPNNMIGQYYGIGLNLLYDTRSNINNPLTGGFFQFKNLFHRKWLGADYQFTTISLDARKYFNFHKDQTFALRAQVAGTFSSGDIPFTGYQRLGGKKVLRGYYDGTYLDKHLMAFDVEYRLPLWQDDSEPIWKIWKHLGIVGFISTGQVFSDYNTFSLSDFQWSAGGGLRILLSKKQRVNIRIDYGVGFEEDAGGIGKKQRGFYMTINETF